jgi:predicted phosphodiesterase
VFAVAAAGAVLGLLVGGHVTGNVGPFRAELALSPSLSGGTRVAIPPLGALQLATHSGPAQLRIRLDALDQQRTEALVNDPNGIARAGEGAVGDLSIGVRRLILQVLGVSVLGSMALGALVYRSMRRIALCGGASLLLVAGTAGIVAGTFRPDAIEEPRYEGLLTNAPAVIGDAQRIAGQYEAYRDELQRLVRNVSRLYGTFSTLPVYEPDANTIRVLHISDMHLNPAGWSVVQSVVSQFNIDAVVDTGDITDWGSEPEASFVDSIAGLKVPYVYVRGNHDSGITAAAVARQPNAVVLDNSIATVAGLTFAGTGDPRFTPDKTTRTAESTAGDVLVRSGTRLSEKIHSSGRTVDVALVHDPASAQPLSAACPLVLAGHLHRREVRALDVPLGAAADAPHTLLMVEGSTGGAGLRGLETDQPTPLELSVLYFSRDRLLQAYDDIVVGGTGQTEVTLERHTVKAGEAAAPTPSTGPARSPAGSLTPSPP